MKIYILLMLCAVLVAQNTAFANDEQRKELIRTQKTTFNLIQLLVDEGLLSEEKAQRMKILAEKQAMEEMQKQLQEKPIDPDTVRVNYVPDFVREQIRDELRKEMKEDVLEDVLKKAKDERWGMPGAWPEWVSKINVTGDMRVRYEYVDFAESNDLGEESLGYVDVMAMNEDRRFNIVRETDQQRYLLNTTEDYDRIRVRARLKFEAMLSDLWSAGLRFKTGERSNPITCCSNLGRNGSMLNTGADNAYLKFDLEDKFNRQLVDVTAGRFDNPFYYTNLVWDHDFTFDGMSSTFRYRFLDDNGLNDNNVFLILGAFTLGDFNQQGQKDKSLYAYQFGINLKPFKHHRLQLSYAYYDFENEVGEANPVDQRVNDYTAPEFATHGNTMFNIDSTSVIAGGESSSTDAALFALSSEYELINYMIEWEWNRFDPVNITLFYDYVKNIGWDTDDINERINSSNNESSAGSVLAIGDVIEERTTGYKYGIKAGHKELMRPMDWRLVIAYRYLEADAVIDAYPDSDFHTGGTDTKGLQVEGGMGIGKGTSLNLKYLSADEIDGLPFGVDTWQLDWTGKF